MPINHMLRIALFLLLAYLPSLLHAQCGTITLSTQSDIDNFFTNHPGCDSVNNLIIKGNDIVSLQGLNGITYVGSISIVSNPLLQNLHGLESIQHINLDCTIGGNSSLLSTAGLENATGIKGWLSIDNNIKLTDLSGLAGIEKAELVSITGNDLLVSLAGMENFKQAIPAGSYNLFTIENNPRLVNLQGLNGLEGGFYLQIDLNDGLVSLDGLDHLVYAKGITLHNNPKLADIKGLRNMAGCKEYVSIQVDPKLKTLEGLEKITETNLSLINNQKLESLKGLDNLHLLWGLSITQNPSLVSITALSNVSYIKDCSIHDNASLNLCSIPFFCELSLPFPSKYSIYNNGNGCSPANIIFGCNNALSTIEGKLFIDLNCNQIFDATEYGVPYHLLNSGTPPLPWSSTNVVGFHFNFLLSNTTITLSPATLPHFSPVPTSQEIIIGNQYQGFDGVDFAFCPDTLIHDIVVHQSQYKGYRPGFTTQVQVCVEDIGVYAEHVVLKFDIEDTPAAPFVTIADANGGGVINGKSVTWDLTVNDLFTPACFIVTMQVDPLAPVHEYINTLLSAETDNTVVEIDYENNMNHHAEKIRNSHDPNEKVVDQDRVDFSTDAHPLDYTIRFQNTGNFPATFIEVLDTLQNQLDMTTFRMIDASHVYQLSFPDTNVISWRFDDIELPDSLTDEAGSHGFIHYSIQSKSNLPVQTTIANRANIYFDYNSPVITGDALTEIVFPDNVKDVEQLPFEVNLFPNPVRKEVNLKCMIMHPLTIKMEIISLDGMIWQHHRYSYFDTGEYAENISLHGIPPGIYLIHFTTGQRHEVKKLVVQD